MVLEILNCHVTHTCVLIGPQFSRAIRAGKNAHVILICYTADDLVKFLPCDDNNHDRKVLDLNNFKTTVHS